MSVAGVAHPVERHLAKVEVASSSLVTRSKKQDRFQREAVLFLLALTAMTLLNISMSLEFTIFLCYNYFIRQSNEVLRFVCSAFFL